MSGIVYLVGAGVGDPELITVKAKRLLNTADVLVYDQLANKVMLNEVPVNCEKIFVGKMSNNHTLTQDEINQLIVKKARENKSVVRLKGGDPYVFGRGGEEGEILRKEGINFEVVPGITSAVGGLAYAGIPITHREDASDFHVYTGHFKSEEHSFDFETISKLTGTLVFLMGVKNIEKIMEGLIKAGKDPKIPAAIIRKASYPEQETWIGTLDTLGEMKVKHKIKPPCLLVIGHVVKRREHLNFFEEKPLFGQKVVVTRSRTQSSRLVQEIIQRGGEAIEVPAISIHPTDSKALDLAIESVNDYQYIVLTSENGVNILFDRVEKLGKDARCFGQTKFVAIGAGTARTLKRYGIKADIMPERYVGEEVVAAMKAHVKSTDKILVPRAMEARPYIVDALSEIASVTEIKTYETRVEVNQDISVLKEALENPESLKLTFTSSSTVKNFMKICKENDIDTSLFKKSEVYSIGPITSETIKDYDLSITKEAAVYTIDGILEMLTSK